MSAAVLAGQDAPNPNGAHPNLPLPPLESEQRLATSPFEITAWEKAGGGVTGAKKLTITFRDRLSVAAKWKRAPSGGDGWNNSPRREIGVYAVQKLFLDAADYLVPPTIVRGIEFEIYRAIEPDPAPNLDGVRCVYGSLAMWMTNCHPPERVLDRARIARDPRYAYHFGNLNLLHYLVGHRDARTSNFLISNDPDNPQRFSIDNGISFGEKIFNFLVRNFNKLRVRALPRRSIERLRRVSRADLERLAVLAELRADDAGVLRHVAPGPNLDPETGNRVRPGVLQIGLTSAEIAAVAQRMEQLLCRVDQGELATF